MEKRRIAVVASTFGVGGAEIITGNVLRRLPKDRYDIRLFFLHEAGVIGRDLFAEGFAGQDHLCRFRRDPAGALRLARSLRSFRPDLLWSLDHMDAMWLGRGAACIAGTRASVIASHSTGLVGANGRAKPSFGSRERALLEFVTRVVAVSPTHARYLSRVTGLPLDRIAVIENGIDVAAWPTVTTMSRRQARNDLGIGEDAQVVTMIAGLRPEKAHEVLLDAIAMLAGRTRIRVLLAGDGPRREALEEHAARSGIKERVEFLGVRRDVARLLHASDVVVLPSRDVVETLPLSVLEAMASAVPVIASRAGSVPDVVIDGETGLLVTPGSADELARAIAAVLDDREAAARRTKLARARVETYYSVDRTTAGYVELFDKVMTA